MNNGRKSGNGSVVRELGQGSGKDFVARIDLVGAAARIVDMVGLEEAADQHEVRRDGDGALAEGIGQGECVQHEVFEIAGAIRWFDASRGYGFIVPDDDLPEAELNGTTLRTSGFTVAPIGARLTCEVVTGPSGLCVSRVLSMDTSTGSDPSQMPKDEPHPAAAEGPWETASVRWFNAVRGYGYLSIGARRPIIYCQCETMRRYGFFELRPGQRLQVRWGPGKRGPTVAEMRACESG